MGCFYVEICEVGCIGYLFFMGGFEECVELV